MAHSQWPQCWLTGKISGFYEQYRREQRQDAEDVQKRNCDEVDNSSRKGLEPDMRHTGEARDASAKSTVLKLEDLEAKTLRSTQCSKYVKHPFDDEY